MKQLSIGDVLYREVAHVPKRVAARFPRHLRDDLAQAAALRLFRALDAFTFKPSRGKLEAIATRVCFAECMTQMRVVAKHARHDALAHSEAQHTCEQPDLSSLLAYVPVRHRTIVAEVVVCERKPRSKRWRERLQEGIEAVQRTVHLREVDRG